jgi:hypothetical protein
MSPVLFAENAVVGTNVKIDAMVKSKATKRFAVFVNLFIFEPPFVVFE